MMLRKTVALILKRYPIIDASMRPQHDAAENDVQQRRARPGASRFNEAAA